MPLPDIKDIYRPILEALRDGGPHNLAINDLISITEKYFGLDELSTNDRNSFKRNITQAKNDLKYKKFLANPSNNTYIITAAGLDYLNASSETHNETELPVIIPEVIEAVEVPEAHEDIHELADDAHEPDEEIQEPQDPDKIADIEDFEEIAEVPELDELPDIPDEPDDIQQEVHDEPDDITLEDEPEHEETHEAAHEEAHEELHEETHEVTHEEAHEDALEATHEEMHEETHEAVHEATYEEAHEETHEDALEATHEEPHEETHEDALEPETMTEEPQAHEDDELPSEYEDIAEAPEPESAVQETNNDMNDVNDMNENSEMNNINAENSTGIEDAIRIHNEELAEKVLSRMSELPTEMFEVFVIDLLSKMGYRAFQNARYTSDEAGSDLIHGVIIDDKTASAIYIHARKSSPDKTIGRADMQDFIDALSDKGGKGIFATTANFSEQAEILANDERIMLIDGLKLAGLMIAHNFCVKVERVYEVKEFDTESFSDYQR